MRYIFFLSVIIICSCHNSEQKTAEVVNHVSNHSKEFNQSIQQVLNDYYKMTQDFVNWDSTSVSTSAAAVGKGLDNINLGTDSVYSVPLSKAQESLHKDLAVIMQISPRIEQKRRSFNSFTQKFFQLLSDLKYDAGKLYLQECPMAFNDAEPGVWISEKDTIINPYMGLHHPRYSSAMIECGSNKSTIDFVSANQSNGKNSSTDESKSKDKEEKNTSPDESQSKDKKD